ncbi:MAG TPA: hypothetical protein VMU19_11580, partial [Bryobacteraceae bacterium]|nr:hypothetical protein [Bryobacteraceae bacterium]
LSGGGESCAFELKRWQDYRQELEILDKDYPKLKGFLEGRTGNAGAYSIISTVNDNGPLKWSAETPAETLLAKYKKDFEDCLAERYSLSGIRVKAFDEFTVCAMMAAPKTDGAA